MWRLYASEFLSVFSKVPNKALQPTHLSLLRSASGVAEYSR